MSVKKWFILCSIVIFSTAAYAQRGVTKAVETAVERQVFNRAKLPTLRDGMRNLVTRRLGGASTASKGKVLTPILINPTRSALDFENQSLTAPQERWAYPVFFDIDFRLESSEDRIKRGDFFLEDSFDDYIIPGSGNVSAVALEPSLLIDKRKTDLKNYKKIEKMERMLDKAFVEKDGLQLAPGYSFERVHKMIQYVKNECPFYVSSKEIALALDVLDIQAWMLAHDGRFPQILSNEPESFMALKFEKLMEKIANEPELSKSVIGQALVRHLVHLRVVAKGALSPSQIVLKVLERVDKGGRIPGSSLEEVTLEENALTKELNYVEQLRRANLLGLVIPMKKDQEALALRLQDLHESGRIYQQMIQIIPEFAPDGTLNVPTDTHVGWVKALNTWQAARKAAGLSQTPRSMIMGRFGLPLNFNDLTKEEQTEVLLGTYLKIK